MKKYSINKLGLIGFLIGLFVYMGVSLYASVGLGSNLAMGVAIHLSLSAVTSVAVLFLIFKPIKRKDQSEKPQTHGESSHDCLDTCDS